MTKIVKKEEPVFLTSFEDLSDGQKMQTLIDSGKLPGHVKTVEDAFTIAKMGQELGFQVMQAFHYIIPIQGKLSLSAKALGAVLRRGGVKYRTVEDGVYVYEDGSTSDYKLTDKKVVDIRTKIEFHRDDLVEPCIFSWKEATDMGLTNKDNWKKMPK